MNHTSSRLCTYSGEKLTVLGITMLRFGYGMNKYDILVHVLQGNGTNLLGRDVLSIIKLDWLQVNNINDDKKIGTKNYSQID